MKILKKSLFTTFFEGRHIEENKDNFDVPFHSEASSKYDDIRKNEYKMEDFADIQTADTAGYFGTNHRIKETHNKKFKELDSFEPIKKAIIQ